MKAIETVYNGFRFRSRLEARWAVFFDELGLVYQYESEGYDLGKFGWYLPDFWLPDVRGGLLVEIKPFGKWDNHPMFEYLEEAHNSKNWEVLNKYCSNFIVLSGDPWVNLNGDTSSSAYSGQAYGDFPYYWCVCPCCGRFGIEWEGYGNRVCGGYCVKEGIDTRRDERLVLAYTAARQARFEHQST